MRAMKVFKDFKPIRQVVKTEGTVEHYVEVKIGFNGSLEVGHGVTDTNPKPGSSWGNGWVSNYSVEEYLALKEIFNKIEMEDEEKDGRMFDDFMKTYREAKAREPKCLGKTNGCGKKCDYKNPCKKIYAVRDLGRLTEEDLRKRMTI